MLADAVVAAAAADPPAVVVVERTAHEPRELAALARDLASVPGASLLVVDPSDGPVLGPPTRPRLQDQPVPA